VLPNRRGERSDRQRGNARRRTLTRLGAEAGRQKIEADDDHSYDHQADEHLHQLSKPFPVIDERNWMAEEQLTIGLSKTHT
jgi:hypothetical protein